MKKLSVEIGEDGRYIIEDKISIWTRALSDTEIEENYSKESLESSK